MKEQDLSTLEILGFVESEATYVLHDDDGESYGYEQGELSKTTFYARRQESGGMRVEVRGNHPTLQTVRFTLMDGEGEIWNEEVKVQHS